MSESIWSESAEQYAKSARAISFYQQTAALTAEILENDDYQVFVDLGCGSSNLVLDALLGHEKGQQRHVTCTDAAAGMVAVAEQNNPYPNAQFRTLRSEELAFDASSVCCFLANSSFWMFDFDKTLPLIHAQLKNSGGLLVNFSEWDLEGGLKDEMRYDLIDQELAARGLPAKQHQGTPKKYCQETLVDIVGHHGFQVDKVITKTVHVTKQDWIAFYQIPEIARKSLSHIPLEDALTVLRSAMEKLPETYRHPMEWLFIKATKIEPVA